MGNGDRLPPDELLYRTLVEEHVDGDRVLDDAVDTLPCSFDRSSMSTPDQALARRPHEPRLMQIRVSDLPDPIYRETVKKLYSYDAVHRPEDDNVAHSHVELVDPSGVVLKRAKPEDFEKAARSKLVERLRVLPVVPAPPAPS